MWIASLAQAASDTPPQVPYEFFGVIASALIAGITGIIVAIVQRTKRSNSSEAAPDSGSRPFMLSEADWRGVRDRSISTKSALDMLDRQLSAHIRDSDEMMGKIREDIANIKGQLGIQ